MPGQSTHFLAIESSGRFGSVAALAATAGEVDCLHQIVLSENRRTAQTLAPALHDLLQQVRWAAGDVDCVAVANGPGSFTGLRIGVTAAKMWAYATAADIVGVNTLAALAYQAPATALPLWTVMDAQRGEIFAARFDSTTGIQPNHCEVRVISSKSLLEELRPGEYITGQATNKLQGHLPADVQVVDSARWKPTAEGVGRIGIQVYESGHRDDVWQLVPNYFRPSAAEEKWAESRKDDQ